VLHDYLDQYARATRRGVLAGRHEQVGRGYEAQQWRRWIIEAGNSAGICTLADELDQSDRTQAEHIRRYDIELGRNGSGVYG
jgi:hypothetical protein